MNAPTDDERIRQHADLVYRTCLRLTGNAQDAADVTQEVFVAWLRQHREITGSVAAWLYGTARLRSLDWLRSKHRRTHHELSAANDPGLTTADVDWQQQLDAAIAELETPVRTLVVEHHLLGLTQGELAKRHRCTQATISRRLTQALETLRDVLQRRGVTMSAALLVGALTASRAAGCPPELASPVLAQAHVAGSTALLGPPLISGMGWAMWVGLTAATLSVLLVVCVWSWQTRVLADLDRDWLTMVLGGQSDRPHVVAPVQGHRYPSIEALIAQLPSMDAELQRRVWTMLSEMPAPKGGRADTPAAAEKLWQQMTSRRELTAERATYATGVISLMSPVLKLKATAPLMIGEASDLAAAYAHGQLASSEERRQWGARSWSRIDVAIDVVRTLVKGLNDNTDGIELLDAWVRAHDRGCATLATAIIVQLMYADRDVAYLSLIQGGKLDAERTRAWLEEPSPMQDLAERGIHGSVLWQTIPWLEDLRRTNVGWLQPLARFDDLQRARGTGIFLPRLGGLHAALVGQAIDFRVYELDDDVVLRRIASGVLLCLNQTAWQSSLHRANRVAARLILDARAGKKLPEQLDTAALNASADWRLRYERISDDRFKVVIDPQGGIPAYTNSEEAAWLRNRANHSKRMFEGELKSVPQVGVELSVTASAQAPIIFTPSEEPEPTVPSVAQ